MKEWPKRVRSHLSHQGRSQAVLLAVESEPDQAQHLVAVPNASSQRTQTLHPKTIKRRLALADLCAVLLGLATAFVVQVALWPVDGQVMLRQWLLAVASLPFAAFAAKVSELYTARANERPVDEARHIMTATVLGVAGMVGLAFLAQVDELARGWVVVVFGTVTMSLIIERGLARMAFRRLRAQGKLTRPILIVGADQNAAELVDKVQRRPELGYRILGAVGDDPRITFGSIPLLGDLTEIEKVAAETGATGVMISLYSVDGTTVNALTRQLTDAGLHVTLCSSLCDIDTRRLRVQALDRQTMLYVEPTIRTGWRRVAMRVFDYSVAIVGLLLTAPLMLLASIAIRVESPGPVIFRQRRVGEHGQSFDILKLRTMCNGADQQKHELLDQNESDGALFKIRDDPRITRVGRVLRKFSIDEVPQFWNVVRGEMSVVGPRPALPSEVSEWSDDVHERLRVLPGITGMWQVSGRADTSFDEYKRLDLYYVDNWSLLHDVRIVLRTIHVVLAGTGAR